MSKNCLKYAFLPVLLVWTLLFLHGDEHTLLHLPFNGSLTGSSGEVPIQANGVTFEDGVLGKGAYFSVGNQLFYSSAGNIDSTEGTLECWIKPRWDGNDGQSYVLLQYGEAGGMLFSKDGANNLRSIFNLFGENGNPEVGIAINVDNWMANEWHHCAFTWSDDLIKLYLDGVLQAEQTVTFHLPVVDETAFQIGGSGTASSLDAVIDDMQISGIERSSQEIAESFTTGLTINSLTIQPDPSLITQPDTIEILETWWETPQLVADTNLGTKIIPQSVADWTSSNPGVAKVNSNGKITGVAVGNAVITAQYNGVQDSLSVIVKAPVRPPEIEEIDPYLATPARGYLYEMPVVILRYLPTQDGINVDTDVTGWISTLEDLKDRIDRFNKRVKFMLEERSRFRGYKDPVAIPSLGYKVVYMVTVYEKFPFGKESPGNPGYYFPDYNQILTRFNAENFVNNLGVKEFWIWGYHHGNMAQPESNMSSPTTGDISNSSRFNDDLPIYDKTYTQYGYNFTRTQAEAVHNHGHQLEAILSHVNWLQDENTDLFWKKFVGQDEYGNFITGRCGWTHMPPNTTEHYDYENPTLVESDIEDWTPERIGKTTMVNVDTWGDLVYSWPDSETDFHQRKESQFYLYWMQSMPGYGNAIQYGSNYMRNWWEFTADWDAAITSHKGLYKPIDIYIFQGHDFNGDWISDMAVWRPSNGRWYIRGVGNYAWGILGDVPVNGDYNGDGKTDVAVWRPSNGRWYLKDIGGAIWGTGGDIPVPGNYDGDVAGKTDVAVWRPSNGRWYIKGVACSAWGTLGDIPVPGDYDGDGKTEIAVWRPSTGRWYIKGVTGCVWGVAGDIPVPGDYTGDGITDIAVWRPSNGRWYIKGVTGSAWGKAGDIPAPGDYNGDGLTDIAVWRPSNGRWYIKGIGGYFWGMVGDIPLVR